MASSSTVLDSARQAAIRAEARFAALRALKATFKAWSRETKKSQKELAEILAADPAHVSRVLAGDKRSMTIETLFLFVLPSEGFEAFRGTLIGGLTSQASRDEVRTQLGLPSHSKEAQTLPILGRKGAWDRYDSERICIHFEYTEPDERLRMVTVMAADTAPKPG